MAVSAPVVALTLKAATVLLLKSVAYRYFRRVHGQSGGGDENLVICRDASHGVRRADSVRVAVELMEKTST